MRIVLTVLAAVFFGSVLPAPACLICEDAPCAVEDGLRERIAAEGRALIPELREIVTCRHTEHFRQRLLAIETLGEFEDAGAVPILQEIVLEILNPASLSSFGPYLPEAELRATAARALGRLESSPSAARIFAAREGLSLERQREIPRLLGELREPGALEMLSTILSASSDDETAFQAVIQLRRLGTRSQVPAVEARLAGWEEEFSRRLQAGDYNRLLEKRVKYTRASLRIMQGRR